MWSYRKPIIAQVHSWCLAGGGELIGACDIVFASETARFGHPAGRAIGIPPTIGMWPIKIGMLKTKELLFSGDTVDGIEAERIGMINRAIPDDQLDAETMDYCQRIAKLPLDGLTVHKHNTNRWFELMGARVAAMEGADFDAIWHESATIPEFARISREKGLKVALEWRDDPFGDGRGAIPPPHLGVDATATDGFDSERSRIRAARLGVGRNGEPARTAVLVHATGFHARTWDAVVRLLPEDWRVFALDMRGHGASQAPPDKAGADWRELAADLNEWLTQRDLTDVVAAGPSMAAASARLRQRPAIGLNRWRWSTPVLFNPQGPMPPMPPDGLAVSARKRRRIWNGPREMAGVLDGARPPSRTGRRIKSSVMSATD